MALKDCSDNEAVRSRGYDLVFTKTEQLVGLFSYARVPSRSQDGLEGS